MGVRPVRSVHAASVGRRIEMKSWTEGKNGLALPDLIVQTPIISLKVEEKDEVADRGHHRAPDTFTGPAPAPMSAAPRPATAHVRGVTRDDPHPGAEKPDRPHRGEATSVDRLREEEVTTRARRRGEAMRGGHQTGDRGLRVRGPEVLKDWLRESWIKQAFSLCPSDLTWRPWLKLWPLSFWLSWLI